MLFLRQNTDKNGIAYNSWKIEANVGIYKVPGIELLGPINNFDEKTLGTWDGYTPSSQPVILVLI